MTSEEVSPTNEPPAEEPAQAPAETTTVDSNTLDLQPDTKKTAKEDKPLSKGPVV